ncbi:MAG: class SAM-dependent methyltransferase, partial [Ilumatobacteraceae bacterium]|nr:class SAM-dependent methyltransferase [Ilumatobacteraceae bacterium]
GSLVLDAGAGTGLAGDAARRRGADVIAADGQIDMLRASASTSSVAVGSVVGDVGRLPFVNDAFDATVAAFVLNHLDDPGGALREIARVTRPDGGVLASTFAETRVEAKSRLDDLLTCAGWVPPEWYLHLQQCAHAVASVDRVAVIARRAGLIVIDVAESQIDVGLDDPAGVVRHRFSLPQLAPFIASLPEQRRAALIGDAIQVVTRTSPSFRPNVIELVAAVMPAAPRGHA